MFERLQQAVDDYENNNGCRYFLRIECHMADLWKQTLVDLSTVRIVHRQTVTRPLGFAWKAKRQGTDLTYLLPYKQWQLLERDAILETAQYRPDQILIFETRQQCECGNNTGFVFIGKPNLSTSKCCVCMRPVQTPTKWELGLTNKRPKTSAGLRRRVIERDGLICQICKGTVEERDIHVDHAITIADTNDFAEYDRKFVHSISNMRVTHSSCNMKKGRTSHVIAVS